MLKWQQLHKRSYLKRMLNDNEQFGERLLINLNGNLDDIFIVICDM